MTWTACVSHIGKTAVRSRLLAFLRQPSSAIFFGGTKQQAFNLICMCRGKVVCVFEALEQACVQVNPECLRV